MITKKYFIKPIGGEVEEVTHYEYAKLAGQQSLANDAETLERVFETATRQVPVATATHTFWTE